MGRFTDGHGTFVGLHRLPHGALSLVQAILRVTTGRIPRQPWIPFSAAKALQRIITPQAKVWEVGAGYSTLWLAHRAGHVTSIEASQVWLRTLSEIIARENIRNIDLRLEHQADRMAAYPGVADGTLDLLFIDGGPRGMCLENGFPKLRSGGYAYLDNWDTKNFWDEAVDFPERHRDEITESTIFIDYVPAQFGVYRGLLLRKR